MRYLVGLMCVLALAVMGCSETSGTGGTGGIAGTGGLGGTGGVAGTGGIGGDGGNGGMPECDTAKDCEDGNECTADGCNPATGMCEYAAVPDGRSCEEERGGCYAGLCNFVPVSASLGAEEVVFDWTTDRCDDFDLPDSPAKVVRAEDGELVLFALHEQNNYLMRGAGFNSLESDCAHPAHQSANLPTPESYENNEWLVSPYRVGENWHVLMHNEFHPEEPPPCGGPLNPCWYNSITYAVSTDSAYSFAKPGAPAHVVAPAPYVWVPPPPGFPPSRWYVTGYLGGTNIVLGPDSYYYTLFGVVHYLDDWSNGVCVMRTKSLDDPASWRAWDGEGFDLSMTSPYVTGTPAEVCAFLQTPTGPLPRMTASLTYNTYLERFVLVDHFWVEVCGFQFSLSSDLIHWSDTQLMAETPDACGSDPPGYPSIVDHEDSTINFERPGQTPHVYYTIYHSFWLDRDLVRAPLTFKVYAGCEGVDCDDENVCTVDACNPVDGSCDHTPAECAVDFNDCTTKTCDPLTGCGQTAVADGTPCAGGTCQSGACALTGTLLPCTEQGIRNAIAAGGGPYTFDCDPPIPIATEAEIVIDRNVSLHGEGRLIVYGNRDHRVLSVAQGVNVELRGITVTGGSTAEEGGGILNAGTLAVVDSTISGNSARRSGGLRNLETGALTLANSTVSQNTAEQFGGGMHNFGEAELVETTVSYNTAQQGSGGISNFTISGSATATMTLTRSTVVGNTTPGGSGGIGNRGTLTVTNSTVSGNAANSSGGIGNVSEGTMTLVSTTVARNSSTEPGTAISNEGSATLRNTLIEGDCSLNTPLNSLGGNIESEGNTCGLAHPTDQTSVIAPFLLLDWLWNNGGPTMTHALLPGSVAIDWIHDVMCVDADGAPLTTDQRGMPRPAGAEPMCDVGAFEAQP